MSESKQGKISLDEKLSVENLNEVVSRITDAHAQWYEIGVALKIPLGTLDGFDKPPKVNFIKVMNTWLVTDPNPTWKTLVDAVSGPLVGRPDLGEKVRNA